MPEEAKQAKAFVKRKIAQLFERRNESGTKAALAKLRRGIGKAPGSMPELWGSTLDGLPEALMGRGDSASRGEWAVYTALTLYALHQQGKENLMNNEGNSLGVSVRKLIKDDEDEKRIKRRFDAAATSAGIEEFSHHLRGLVQLFKAADIPLDYPALTEDLYLFQFTDKRDAVRLRWGRDYYRAKEKSDEENQKNKGKEENDQ